MCASVAARSAPPGFATPARRAVAAVDETTRPSRSQDSLTPEDFTTQLLAIPGIGRWTVDYIFMRARHEPDAFPISDLGLRKAASNTAKPITPKRLASIAENWRPWRSYAAMYLWAAGSAGINLQNNSKTMLQMKDKCQACNSPLLVDAIAYICSFECTYCEQCAKADDHRCPNCGGELVRRPRREKEN